MALLGSGLASAHMIMKTPTPYGASSMTNGPLAADGSDYPCKQRPGVYDKGSASNTMAVGSPQTLSFTGSAVHGGGSCQLSLTKDLKPTKDTDFRVILSIEGGCPANTAVSNFPSSFYSLQMLTPNLGEFTARRARIRCFNFPVLNPSRRRPRRLYACVDLVQQTWKPRDVHELRSHHGDGRLEEAKCTSLRFGRQSLRKTRSEYVTQNVHSQYSERKWRLSHSEKFRFGLSRSWRCCTKEGKRNSGSSNW